MRANL